MKKLNLLITYLIIGYLSWAIAPPAWSALRLTFKDMIGQADVIVEGLVLDQADSANKLYQENVGSHGVAVVLSFGPVQQTKFYVTKVYKGQIKLNQIIDIYTDSNESKTPVELKIKKEYLMFLNQKWDKKGYQVVNKGKGYWQIFDYDGQKRLKAWNQDPRLRKPEAYLSYADFVKDLKGSLSKIAFGEEE